MAQKRTRYPYSIILNALQSPVNIGRILRTCEVFQVNVGISDTHDILKDKEKRKTVSDFACGALDRTDIWSVGDLNKKSTLQNLKKKGRIIATCIGQKAVELPDFKFKENDMIIIGNEYDGLPLELIKQADAKLYIPMPKILVPKFRSFYPIDPDRQEDVKQNGLANLSASTSANIISYAIYLQARKKQKKRTKTNRN